LQALLTKTSKYCICNRQCGKMCVDPGETGTALQAGGVRGPGLPIGEKDGQLASVSGKGRT
jgi:hypothetical protein